MSLKSEVLNSNCYRNIMILFRISDFIFSNVQFHS
nr:MAG TPA: hypothetical protein [Bacteriophage sp.]